MYCGRSSWIEASRLVASPIITNRRFNRIYPELSKSGITVKTTLANVPRPILLRSPLSWLILSAALLRLVRNVKIMSSLGRLYGDGFFSVGGVIHILKRNQRRITVGQDAFVQLWPFWRCLHPVEISDRSGYAKAFSWLEGRGMFVAQT
jgi:hypothetical protein